MKEVVDVLDRVVRDEVIKQIVVACDEVAKPLLMEQLPKHLAEKIVDVLELDINTPEHRVLAETMETLRERDAETDAEQVEEMLGAWRGTASASPGLKTRSGARDGPGRRAADCIAESPATWTEKAIAQATSS